MPRTATPPPAIPLARNASPPHALRWPVEDVRFARSRLHAHGFDDQQATDYLDYLAMVRGVRSIKRYLSAASATNLELIRARPDEVLGELRAHARHENK